MSFAPTGKGRVVADHRAIADGHRFRELDVVRGLVGFDPQVALFGQKGAHRRHDGDVRANMKPESSGMHVAAVSKKYRDKVQNHAQRNRTELRAGGRFLSSQKSVFRGSRGVMGGL